MGEYKEGRWQFTEEEIATPPSDKSLASGGGPRETPEAKTLREERGEPEPRALWELPGQRPSEATESRRASRDARQRAE